MSASRNSRTFWILLAASLITVLVALPRFDRIDVGYISELSSGGTDSRVNLADARDYILFTRYFRGEVEKSNLTRPFAHRPLAPFLASKLPASPLTALNLVNLAALVIAVTATILTITKMGIGLGGQMVGAALFSVSFPVFWYGAVGFVDPVLIACLSLAVLFLVTDRRIPLIFAIIVGSLAKESAVILLPSIAVLAVSRENSKQWQIILLISTAVVIIVFFSLRLWIPATANSDGFPWAPKWALVVSNTNRPYFWASVLATAGPIIVALGYGIRRSLIILREDLVFIVGIAAGIGLTLFSVVAAYSDSRPLWVIYPFALPLIARIIDRAVHRMTATNEPQPTAGQEPDRS